MGRGSYGEPKVHVYRGDTARVSIGSFTSVADDCEMMVAATTVRTGSRRGQWRKRSGGTTGETLWSKGDITIGNDVWLGRGAKILSGTMIGDGAVVAAYTVVTQPVRPYAIIGGNPATEIRRRFDDETVEALLRNPLVGLVGRRPRVPVGKSCLHQREHLRQSLRPSGGFAPPNGSLTGRARRTRSTR